MNATQLIYSAERLIGEVQGPGQTLSTAELADGLATLNALLASWSIERLIVPSIAIAAYALTTTQQSYPIGPGAAAPFNVARPIRIESAGILVPDGGQAGTKLRMAMKIIQQAEWSKITAKSASATVPSLLYYDHAGIVGNLNLWPNFVSTAATQIELATWQALLAFPDVVTDQPMLPGYDRAIIYNLAIDLAGAFGVEPPASVVMIARQAKAAIEAMDADGVPKSAPPNSVEQAQIQQKTAAMQAQQRKP
jgi:hypothetical protein